MAIMYLIRNTMLHYVALRDQYLQNMIWLFYNQLNDYRVYS